MTSLASTIAAAPPATCRSDDNGTEHAADAQDPALVVACAF